MVSGINKLEFLKSVNDLLELEPGTIKGDEELSSMASWDSLAILGFIALVHQNFGIVLAPADVVKSKNIADLIMLLEDKVNG